MSERISTTEEDWSSLDKLAALSIADALHDAWTSQVNLQFTSSPSKSLICLIASGALYGFFFSSIQPHTSSGGLGITEKGVKHRRWDVGGVASLPSVLFKGGQSFAVANLEDK